MRIFQVISHYMPAYSFGGPLQVAHGLGRALVEQGHEVTVCCTNLKDSRSELSHPIDQPVSLDGVKIYYERVPWARYWGYSPGLRRRVAIECRRHDLVISHFHYQYASYAAGVEARQAGVPYVVFTHGTLNRAGVTARSRCGKAAYLRLLEQRNFRRALFMVYHSQEELAQSLQYGRCEVFPIGVDFDALLGRAVRGEFRREHPSIGERFVFLYMGRLATGKGLELLIPVFRRIAASRDVHLVLMGGDELGFEQRLRRLVRKSNLDDRVTFTGLLTGAAKAAALTDADAFVLPSRSEGLSLATLEAMAMNLPVIITNRMGLWPEVRARDCGLVIDYDQASLERALGEMVGRTDRPAMGGRGHDYVLANYDWRSISRALVAKVQSAIPSALPQGSR